MITSEMRTPLTRASSNLAPPPTATKPVGISDTRGRVPTVAALCHAEWKLTQQRLPSLALARPDGKARNSHERPIDRRLSERKLQRTSRFDLRLNAHLQSVENRFAKLHRSNESGAKLPDSTLDHNAHGGAIGTGKPLTRGLSTLLVDETSNPLDHVVPSLKPLSPFKDLASSGYYSDSRRVAPSADHVTKSLSPRQGKQTADVIRETTTATNGLGVTLLDIANLSQKTVAKRDREHEQREQREQRENSLDMRGKAHTDTLLFNTFQDIERFRNLLREEEKQLEEEKRESRRVNYCDQAKSRRIEEWLRSVAEIQESEGVCTETVDETIEDETFHVDNIACID